jgi:hypothetical protein
MTIPKITKGGHMTIVNLLKQQHQQLIGIMDRLEQVSDVESDSRDEYFQQFKATFNLHDKIEDKIVYPALKKYPELEKLILKSYQAHHVVEVGILELRMVPYNSDNWGPKFSVIRDSIMMHMTEEETKVFPKAEMLVNPQELDKLAAEAKALIEDEK